MDAHHLFIDFQAAYSFIHSFIHVHVIYNRHLMGHRIWNKSICVSINLIHMSLKVKTTACNNYKHDL